MSKSPNHYSDHSTHSKMLLQEYFPQLMKALIGRKELVEVSSIIREYQDKDGDLKTLFKSVNASNKQNPIMVACHHGCSLEVINHLFDKAQSCMKIEYFFDTRNNILDNIFMIACMQGRLDLVKYLLQKYKAKVGDVKSYLERPNVYKEDAYTIACKKQDNISVLKYIAEEYRKAGGKVEDLIYHKNFLNITPIAIAALNKDVELMKYLLMQGAHPKELQQNKEVHESFKQLSDNDPHLRSMIIETYVEKLMVSKSEDHEHHPIENIKIYEITHQEGGPMIIGDITDALFAGSKL